jgi:hypothetical protein
MAEFIEVAHRMGGADAAKELARKRRGKQFDPTLADLLDAEADIILAGLDTTRTWDAVIDAEPALAILLSGGPFDAALVAIANFVDLKSPYFLGHARAVSELAAEAGARVRLDEAEVRTLRCAAPAWCTVLAAWGFRTRSGTSPTRSEPANGSACACIHT